MTEDTGLKRRIKQWKRASKYLKKAGYIIVAANEKTYEVCRKEFPDVVCYVDVYDRAIFVTTPHEKVITTMFPGKTTQWLYDQIYSGTKIPFVYNKELDEIYSSMFLENVTDNTVFETVNLIWQGYLDFICAVNETKEKCESQPVAE